MKRMFISYKQMKRIFISQFGVAKVKVSEQGMPAKRLARLCVTSYIKSLDFIIWFYYECMVKMVNHYRNLNRRYRV